MPLPIFIKKTKSRRVFNVLMILVVLYFIGTLILTIYLENNKSLDLASYYCSHSIKNGCITTTQTGEPTNKIDFLLSFNRGAYVGSCLHKSSENDWIWVWYQAAFLKRYGDKLKINFFDTLKPKEKWEDDQAILVTLYNPWRYRRAEITLNNRGLVNCQENNENLPDQDQTLVITGRLGFYWSSKTTGTIIFVTLIVFWIFSFIYSRRLRKRNIE